MTASQLPPLSALPTRNPSSCASLSVELLDLLDANLPAPPGVTLSVGSGPGLLEALFLERHPYRASGGSFFGVEVASNPPVNRFLPQGHTLVVPGTWAIADKAPTAKALIFVYPRETKLLAEYLSQGTQVETVVLIGPRCDLPEYVGILKVWGDLLQDFETVQIFQRKGLESLDLVEELDISTI
ncbi:hypothetical protein GQ53DRAFT_775894 [Thozetella sp. PMI_491]|nr:hypothetical protein GQ53DRAFT_775894 [Thozetella sp. PMI_491]